MPFYLRRITKSRWYKINPPPSWLLQNEIPAQPLADVVPRPDENLSLWRIDDHRSNLNRVAAAIASGREKLDKLDYALFSIAIIDQLGLTVVQSSGNTPDVDVNSNWHWEIIELTANKAVLLAKELYASAEITRKLPIAVLGLIQEEIRLKHLIKTNLNPKLIADLNEGHSDLG
ncbi:MAG: hypothetical protein ACREIJ_01830 [Nitrospiraceae bacterium]